MLRAARTLRNSAHLGHFDLREGSELLADVVPDLNTPTTSKLKSAV